ncbi:MAG: cyclophilin-like fold protein [Ruminococcus flavefaciens]|nr:cyclophilin-like fold protein [Ruminococcus flavefaciens]
MKKFLIVMLSLFIMLGLTACGNTNRENQGNNGGINEMTQSYQMKIIVGDQELTADMYDNATSRAIKEMLPMELPMELSMLDLYGREMCYRFSDALPTDHAYNRGYEVGEIVYYPPMHSFVIMYEQNGEHFQMQGIGKIQSGVEFFEGIGNTTVRFELMEENR